ncbi:helix-turn-helix domain-containing protein [Anaerofustis stercorihominis]|uniref:helix-turn-helix domain-containing protein n=1 Tax=Anaerofustis stercorihominis TaxID=214853 RepID=UPI00214CBD12|nr:helix-turn-helix transcriptional regulator [Anaerofustis stercorihominis]MCR2033455.1 helix-turn-helix domain-containing protein [Anaerofustis stercorihominis]
MKTGEKISKARKNINLTQDQLAEVLDVSRQTISKWESDIAYPEAGKLKLLSDTLNVSIDYLLNDEAEETKVPEMKQTSNGYEVDWSKLYPILNKYEKEIYINHYFDLFSNLIKEAMKKYNYSLEDATLVLKDIYYKAYLKLKEEENK